MPTLHKASPVDAPKAPVSAARRRWDREGALILIISGDPAERLPIPADEVERIAAEMESLRAQGVGERRAATLLARLRAGDLHAIDGGGEASPGRRPGLRLVSDARPR